MDLHPRLFAARKRGEKDAEIFLSTRKKKSSLVALLCCALHLEYQVCQQSSLKIKMTLMAPLLLPEIPLTVKVR